MGIEVLSPADAFFAPLTGAAPLGGAPAAGESVPGGAFAALLAMLAGDGAKDGETGELLLTAGLPLPGDPAEGKDDGEAAESELALAALLLAPAPAITTPAQAATEAPPDEGGTTSAIQGATIAQSASAAPPAEAPAAPAADELPEPAPEAETAAPVGVTAQDVSEGPDVPRPAAAVEPPAQSASIAPPVTVAETPVATAAVVQAQPEAAATEAQPVDAPNDGEEPPPVESTADGPPTEAAPPAKEDSKNRVVRFVGNAETANENGIAHRRQPEVSPAKGTPKASAEAIAHAADNSAVAKLRTMDTSPTGGVDAPQAPAPAEPPAPMEQVGHAVIERAEQGGGEATITLDPVELGEVRIHVRIDGDAVSVDVQTERPEAMHLLRESTLDLSSLLGERGLDLADVFVGMGQGRFQGEAPGDSHAHRRNGSENDFAELLGIDAGPATRQHNRLRDAYNPDGAHVYRV